MRHTVIGILADREGFAYNPEARTRAWSTPAAEIKPVQDPTIPVDRDHDGRPVGRVVHLEHAHGSLWCVAEVDTEPHVLVRVGADTLKAETPLYFSAERWGGPEIGGLLLRSVALTPSPARISARPLTWFEGGLDQRGSWKLEHPLKGLVARAAEADFTRHGRPLVVHDDADPNLANEVDRFVAESGPVDWPF